MLEDDGKMKETILHDPSELDGPAPDICNRTGYPGCPFLGDLTRGKTKTDKGIIALKNCVHPERLGGDHGKLHCIQNPLRVSAHDLQKLRISFKQHGGTVKQVGPKAWILYRKGMLGPLAPQLLETEDKKIVCR